MTSHIYLANNYQVLEAVIVSGHVKQLYLVTNLVCQGCKRLVVVPLDLHALNSRCHLDSVVVPVDLKVL